MQAALQQTRGAPSSTAADAARGRHYALHGRGWNRSLGKAYMQVTNVHARTSLLRAVDACMHSCGLFSWHREPLVFAGQAEAGEAL